jgi:cytochrome c oxidase cbb3-type subunit 2
MKVFFKLTFLVFAVLLPTVATEAETSSGRVIYEANCAICHGQKGDGQGEVAARFAAAPRNFTKGEYKVKSTPSGILPTDADLIQSTKHGLPGTAMVPQDHLSVAELQAVVEYIKNFSPRFANASSQKPLVIPPPPTKSPERLEHGKAVYQKAECAQCHGQDAKGDGPAAKVLAVKPADLTRRPFKGGATVQDLFRTILTGFEGTSMPAYQFILEDEEIWDLVYYLDSLGTPPQQTEDERKGWEVERKYQHRKQ